MSKRVFLSEMRGGREEEKKKNEIPERRWKV